MENGGPTETRLNNRYTQPILKIEGRETLVCEGGGGTAQNESAKVVNAGINLLGKEKRGSKKGYRMASNERLKTQVSAT